MTRVTGQALHPMDTIAGIRRHVEFKVADRSLARDVADRILTALDVHEQVDDDGPVPVYADLLEAALHPPLPSVVFHTASTSVRTSVFDSGLLAVDPNDNPRWHGDAVGQPPGVYVCADPDLRGRWADDDTWDVWRIDTADLEWEHDRLNPGCWRLTETVAPVRLTLWRRDLTW